MVCQKVPHAIFKKCWKDKGVKGMRDVCHCFACSPKLSSEWSVQIAIVSLHKRAVFAKWKLQKQHVLCMICNRKVTAYDLKIIPYWTDAHWKSLIRRTKVFGELTNSDTVCWSRACYLESSWRHSLSRKLQHNVWSALKIGTHDACRVALPRRKFRKTCKREHKTPNPRILFRQRGVNSRVSRYT